MAASELIAQGNALGFMYTYNCRPERTKALIVSTFVFSGRYCYFALYPGCLPSIQSICRYNGRFGLMLNHNLFVVDDVNAIVWVGHLLALKVIYIL